VWPRQREGRSSRMYLDVIAPSLINESKQVMPDLSKKKICSRSHRDKCTYIYVSVYVCILIHKKNIQYIYSNSRMHIYIGSLFKHTRDSDEKLSISNDFIYQNVDSLS
jgi:hypothetical protein